ncbi:hypothetical protein QVA66_01590 [Staphylococcus chromogenes]|nr:hypothetical protein [Staphylococcus chromogenes]
MKRRLALILSPAVLLCACSIASSPTPQPELNSLAQTALNDAAGLQATNPELSAVRRDHAQRLFAEVRRLCGTREDGSTPDTCVVPTADAVPTADTSDIVAKAAADLLIHVDKVPRESMPEVARIHTELAELGASAETSEPPAGSGEARAVLEWENSVVYALKVTLAYAGKHTPAVEDAISRHSARAAALHAALPDAPPAAAAYNLSAYPDPAATMDFLKAIESDSVTRWNISASESDSGAWRRYALSVSAEDARQAQALL